MLSLLEEERCGHLVDADTKKLWNVQLELLKEFQRICKKYNLKYYAIEGTLLGAVRHNGYIPWDDDIDVGMPCEDLDKFCAVVKDELPEYYDFQHFTTQKGFNIGISRIRDNRTTCCTEFEYNYYSDSKDYSFGVFLDIFPLFNISKNKLLQKYQHAVSLLPSMILDGCWLETKKKFSDEKIGTSIKERLSSTLWKMSNNYLKNARKLYKTLNLFKNSKYIGMSAFYGLQNKFIWKKEWFNETIELPYEDITISCPKDYDALLKLRYGDYNVFVKGGQLHSYVLFDTGTPYREKLKERYLEIEKKLSKR